MKTEVSCGGIVFKREGHGTLVKMIVVGNGANDVGITLPKGHQDDLENLEDAAAREVREESGVKKVRIIDKVGEASYIVKKIIPKIVHIYLMECLEDGEPSDPDNEVIEAKWITMEDAISHCSFPLFKDLLVKADGMLKEIYK